MGIDGVKFNKKLNETSELTGLNNAGIKFLYQLGDLYDQSLYS